MGSFLDLQNTLVLLALSANFFFVILVLARNPTKDLSSRMFIAGASAVVLWDVDMLLFRNSQTDLALTIFSRALYAVAALIPYFFIFFTFYFNKDIRIPRILLYLAIALVFPILAISVMPNGLIIDSYRGIVGEPIIIFDPLWSIIYSAYEVGYFFVAFLILLYLYFHSRNDLGKKQIIYIFLGTFITSGIALVTNLYFPFVGIYEYNWLGQAGSVAMIAFISLAILQYQLFEVQAAATQLFVLILSSFLFIRIFSSGTKNEIIVNIAFFISSLFFGYLVIRSVKEEIRQREEIDKLAKRLSETNWELSKKNEQLRIIDQRKSEFVSIASHQLRTPVTAIKGYASLILENSFGEISIPVRGAVERIFTSSNRLANMINDFLNISKIEQGTMTYQFTDVDLGKMAQELVQEFLVAAGEKRLDLAAEIPKDGRFIVKADEGKIRQILSNLIDNAIKYTPKGNVRVILEKEPNRGKHGTILLKVKDTGVGLSHDDLHHLFGKFARGSEGQKLNTAGSGLGLYVAKKMIEAQRGTVWVDSEGQGKGSVFCIELPVEDLPSGK